MEKNQPRKQRKIIINLGNRGKNNQPGKKDKE